MGWVKFKGSAVNRAPRAISAHTLKRIARLAKIDAVQPGQCKSFFVNLRAAIAVAWMEPSSPSRAIYRGPVIEELAQWSSAVTTLKELIDPARKTDAAVHARVHIRAFLSLEKKESTDSFEDLWKSSLDDIELAVSRATARVQRLYPTSGRPPGGVGLNGLPNVGANLFVSSLILAAETNGGHLPISRIGGVGRGPLIEVVDLLRPYLPASLLPPSTSVRFYESRAAEVARDLKRHQN